ncbi:BamA/TamA family outer membrane protein [Gammaproteobacteria bacterium]
MQYLDALEALGADQPYQAITGVANVPLIWGPHTLVPGIELAGKLAGEMPLSSRFALGGFTKLSGYQDRELNGQYSGLARLIYLYRLNQTSKAFSVPMYAGASLEVGNVWNTTSAIGLGHLRGAGSLFLGIDSPLGPLYLANGFAQGGHQSLYFFLGKTF